MRLWSLPNSLPAYAVTEVSAYELIEKLDEESGFALWRVRRREDGAGLLLRLAAKQAAPAALRRLEHEYALRDELAGAEAAVQPRDLIQFDGCQGLALEDPGGVPLARHLGAPLRLDHFLPVAVAVATALGQIHERGLIHKDLKPNNILLDAATGTIHLTGFGIAARVPRERQALEPPETIVGTLAYMAPEQTGRMNRSVDSRSDLYALGVIFYELLSGALPFAADDAMEWVHCHVARRPPPLAERVADVPEPLSAIVMKLLAKTAEERYQTATGAAADLRRCLAAWGAGGRIEPFALGAQDARDRLLVPEKLYGRARESKLLLDAFERMVSSGSAELVLVSGYSGIGKSSLVNVLHEAMILPRGIFLSGKFDQYKRDIPYDTLTQAFRTFTRQLLIKPEAEIEGWRGTLREALGANGQLVVDLVPELELVLGKQPAVSELPPRDARNRFQAVLTRFIAAVATPEHPLCLFLDDLQWLDAASLTFVEHLIADRSIGHLLLIGAYRDNEVGPAHPLSLVLDQARKAGASVQDIVLTPLSLSDLGQLVADTLLCEPATVEPLALLIDEKTAGNPFFAIQFLSALYDERLLVFNRDAQSWQWNLATIRAKGFTDNVVELMVAKLKRFAPDTQAALAQLACLGNTVDPSIVAAVRGRAESADDRDLWQAVREGLIVPDSYRFIHDRVQEAAYALIPEDQRAAAHLRIGRLLLSRLPEQATVEQIFDVTNQLNRGVDLISDPGEKANLYRLNALVGRRARASSAYASACRYLAQAAALLANDAWRMRHEETFALHLDLAECEYLVGNFQAAVILLDRLLGKAPADLDRAKVYSLRMKLYQVSGRYSDAIDAGLDALGVFGVTCPDAEEAIRSACDAERRDIPTNLRGRAVADLIDAPAATDPGVRAIIGLLVDLAPSAYLSRPRLFPLLALKGLNFSLRHGNTEKSCYCYNAYARLLVTVEGDIPAAFAFSEMALRLNEKFNDLELKGTLLFNHAAFINIWRRPIATSLALIEEAIRACLEIGNLAYACYGAFLTAWLTVVESGASLTDGIKTAEKYAAFAAQSHNDVVRQLILLYAQFAKSLQGRTREPTRFDDETFDEAATLALFTKAGFANAVAGYHVLKMMASFLHERYADAFAAAARVDVVSRATIGTAVYGSYRFYRALTLTALYPDAPAEQRQGLAATLAEDVAQLKLWAENCPETHGDRFALVAAELARIEGRDLDAMRLYEDAIRSAGVAGFIQNEAVASELASRFYRDRGFVVIADSYLEKARNSYLRWGAHGKVKQLDQRFPQRVTPVAASRAELDSPVAQLDVGTVIKASHAVSSQIVHGALVETLLRITVEHAGAERGLLILRHDKDYTVEAEAVTGGGKLTIALRQAPIDEAELALSVLQYVDRMQESVMLDDAAADNLFSDDEYLRRNRTRSLLCLPLIKQGQVIGALYLENNLAPGAFTPDRIAVLELVASQAAISLENARLYSDLQQENDERRRAEERSENYAARVSDLYNKAPCGYHSLDKDGVFVDINDTELTWLGRSRAEVVGRLKFTDVMTTESARRFDEEFMAFKQRGAAREVEYALLRTDGASMPVLLSSTVLTDAAGQYLMSRSTLFDIAERKRAEAAEREREVEARTRESQRLAALGTVAGGVAHEFNNMLVPIISLTKLSAGRLAEGSRERKNLETVLASANRAKDLVKQILAFSRNDDAALVPCDIGLVVEESAQRVRSTLPAAIDLEVRQEPELPPIRCDAVQLQQVVVNLCVNGAQAIGKRPGCVIVRLHLRHVDVELQARGGKIMPGDHVVLEVIDDGDGMDELTMERIFDPFFTTKQVGQGTGLGLSVVYSIVKAHGGAIQVESKPGDGCTVRLFLPILPHLSPSDTRGAAERSVNMVLAQGDGACGASSIL